MQGEKEDTFTQNVASEVYDNEGKIQSEPLILGGIDDGTKWKKLNDDIFQSENLEKDVGGFQGPIKRTYDKLGS